jgi:hypothetical protein
VRRRARITAQGEPSADVRPRSRGGPRRRRRPARSENKESLRRTAVVQAFRALAGCCILEIR